MNHLVRPSSRRSAPRPKRVLTWHVHGSYLWNLVQAHHIQFVLPTRPGRPPGFGGRSGSLPWPPNVQELPAQAIRWQHLDGILFQSRTNYEVDQYELLSAHQRTLPRIYLEHDPPRQHPTDTRHPAADDPSVLLVHVTAFNRLMWDGGSTPTRVVEHGVAAPPGIEYVGDLGRGLVAVNDLGKRGRRLGLDVFERVREEIPLDLVGMGSEALGGLGEVPHRQLPSFAARYRFLFHPARYTSLGLSVIEAMHAGIPVVGLATTELVTVIRDGESGYVDTDPDGLIARMRDLLRDPLLARRLGEAGRRVARERFGIERFIDDWDNAWEQAAAISAQGYAADRAAAAGGAP